ncbi:MAG: MBL fold metallo-hydrolase [Bacteroidota bacterium]|nr:MBL fold metallo-hydrolase [Bacteroidota bacterium]
MLRIQSFTFSPIAENTYVLSNEDGDCIIIDPGCYFGNERSDLVSYVETSNLHPKYLLNTHCHLDHVFGNKFVYETWQLELHLHANEQVVLARAPEAGLRWGMPFDNYAGPLHFIRENEPISLGKDILIPLLAPGHSPGHLCFYCAAQGFVIGGDVLFRMSVGRTDLPGGNHEQLMQSIREQLFVLPDETLVYPGHGEPTTIGFEKRNNPFLQG